MAWSVSSDEQADAFEIYRESLRDIYEATEVADNGRAGFVNTARATRFGPSVVGRGRSVAQTLIRTPETVRGRAWITSAWWST